MVFDAPIVKGGFEMRLCAVRDALKRHNMDKSIRNVLPHMVYQGKSHVLEELKCITNLDSEGVMLHHPTAPYKDGRVSDLLKVRTFFRAEARVVG